MSNSTSFSNSAWLALAFAAVSVTASGCKHQNELRAVADLRNADNGSVGAATLEQVDGGVEITFKGDNLPPGTHGFHIHEHGKCEPPGFESAGGHFNPTHAQHGLDNPKGPHVGDLPNLEVQVNGRAETVVVARGATLESTGDRSLLADGGTALVIHAGEDDQVSDPAGDAGKRIACGVIRRAE